VSLGIPEPASTLPAATRSPARWGGAALTAVAVLAGGVPFLARLELLRQRWFDPDEFQHLHGAWCVARGLVPYRDYFEHHPPGLPYLLAPLLRAHDLDAGSGEGIAALFAARAVMWVFTGGILALAFAVGRAWRDARHGVVAAVLLGNVVLFLDKTLEVRPDVPATFLWLATLWFLIRSGGDRAACLFRAGLCFGAAVLLTQKALFALLGLGPLLLAGTAGAARGKAALRRGFLFATGASAPLLATAAAFAAGSALGPFLEGTLFVNLRWKARFSPRPILAESVGLNPEFAVLALAGLVLVLATAVRRWPEGWSDRVVALGALGPFAGLFVLPVPWHQYHLLYLAPASLLAGAGLLGMAAAAGQALRLPPRASAVLPALLLAAASVGPLLRVAARYGPSNGAKLDAIRFVLQNTTPSETVMDGYTGIGVFRPHAYRRFFLHAEVRAMMDEGEGREILAGLRTGRIAPRLISFDGHLTRVAPGVKAFLEGHYAPVGKEPVWVRLFEAGGVPWTDLGRRPAALPAPGTPRPSGPYLLAASGWSDSEQDGALRVRRSRGRRSLLLLPLHEPADLSFVLRAAPAAAGQPLGFEVSVNRRPLGQVRRLRAGWSDYAFDVPREALVRGLNRLGLYFPRLPREIEPDAGNSVMALESVAVVPARPPAGHDGDGP